eukprot:jgi/Bigna1/77129/fgenesh1_pg.46_\
MERRRKPGESPRLESNICYSRRRRTSREADNLLKRTAASTSGRHVMKATREHSKMVKLESHVYWPGTLRSKTTKLPFTCKYRVNNLEKLGDLERYLRTKPGFRASGLRSRIRNKKQKLPSKQTKEGKHRCQSKGAGNGEELAATIIRIDGSEASKTNGDEIKDEGVEDGGSDGAKSIKELPADPTTNADRLLVEAAEEQDVDEDGDSFQAEGDLEDVLNSVDGAIDRITSLGSGNVSGIIEPINEGNLSGGSLSDPPEDIYGDEMDDLNADFENDDVDDIEDVEGGGGFEVDLEPLEPLDTFENEAGLKHTDDLTSSSNGGVEEKKCEGTDNEAEGESGADIEEKGGGAVDGNEGEGEGELDAKDSQAKKSSLIKRELTRECEENELTSEIVFREKDPNAAPSLLSKHKESFAAADILKDEQRRNSSQFRIIQAVFQLMHALRATLKCSYNELANARAFAKLTLRKRRNACTEVAPSLCDRNERIFTTRTTIKLPLKSFQVDTAKFKKDLGAADDDGGESSRDSSVYTPHRRSRSRLKLQLPDDPDDDMSLLADFKFKTYAPRVFSCIRESFGVPSGNYVSSLCSTRFVDFEMHDNVRSSFITTNGLLKVRSIDSEENKRIRALLSNYFEHVLLHRNHTHLERIFGLYRIKQGKQHRYFVVSQSFFVSSPHIDALYNLSGSCPRLSKLTPQGARARRKNWRMRSGAQDRNGDDNASNVDGKAGERAEGYLDDDALLQMSGINTLPINLGELRKREHMRAIAIDVAFLTANQCCGYRLAVGISYTADVQLTRLQAKMEKLCAPHVPTVKSSMMIDMKMGRDSEVREDMNPLMLGPPSSNGSVSRSKSREESEVEGDRKQQQRSNAALDPSLRLMLFSLPCSQKFQRSKSSLPPDHASRGLPDVNFASAMDYTASLRGYHDTLRSNLPPNCYGAEIDPVRKYHISLQSVFSQTGGFYNRTGVAEDYGEKFTEVVDDFFR